MSPKRISFILMLVVIVALAIGIGIYLSNLQNDQNDHEGDSSVVVEELPYNDNGSGILVIYVSGKGNTIEEALAQWKTDYPDRWKNRRTTTFIIGPHTNYYLLTYDTEAELSKNSLN